METPKWGMSKKREQNVKSASMHKGGVKAKVGRGKNNGGEVQNRYKQFGGVSVSEYTQM